jgi:hypothetical protein
VNIPGGLFELLKGLEELGGFSKRRNEALHHFLGREAFDRVDRRGKAGGEEEGADLAGGFLAGGQVYDLGMGGLGSVPKVFGDDVAHPGDLREFIADLWNGEVEVLGTDEEDIVGLAFPDGTEEAGNQFDEAAGLLELLVFLEQGDDVLQAGVEGVGVGDFVRNGLGAAVGDLGLAGLLKLLAVRIGDVVNFGLILSALSGSDVKRRLRRIS